LISRRVISANSAGFLIKSGLFPFKTTMSTDSEWIDYAMKHHRAKVSVETIETRRYAAFVI